MTTLFFEDGELRAPMIDDPIGSCVSLRIDASDVSIALSRPMDVSITNRLPGEIVEIVRLDPPYVQDSASISGRRASTRWSPANPSSGSPLSPAFAPG